MIIVSFEDCGAAYSDHLCLDAAKSAVELYSSLQEGSVLLVQTSSSLLVTAMRLLVKRGTLHYSKLQFRYRGDLIKVDRAGNLENWPRGFAEELDTLLEEMLDWGKIDN